MGESAGRARWNGWIETRLSRFTQSDPGLRQMGLMWTAAITAVVLACLVFFLALFWLFS